MIADSYLGMEKNITGILRQFSCILKDSPLLKRDSLCANVNSPMTFQKITS